MKKPSLALIPSGYKAGKVYSILPNNNVGDFTFIRNSGATRVNKNGLIENVGETIGSEEVTNGYFDTDTDWTKQNGSTISGGVATVIANGSVGSTGGNRGVQQANVFVAGNTYDITFSVRQTVGSGIFQISNGFTLLFDTTVTSEFTTYTIRRVAGAVNLQDHILAIGGRTVSDEFELTYISVKEVLTEVNIPRLDYSEAGCPSLLLEPQRINLVTFSEDFSNASWNKDNVDITTADIVSPTGELNATKMTINSTSSTRRIYKSVGTNFGEDYTYSLYVKKGTSEIITIRSTSSSFIATFNLSNGTLISGTGIIEDAGNGWYRIQATGTATSSIPPIEIYRIILSASDEVGSYVYIWGSQSEQGSYVTSYIPTNSSTSTRIKDKAIDSGNADVFSSSEGTLFVDILPYKTSASSMSLSLSDSSTSNIISIIHYPNDETRILVASGGVTVFNNYTDMTYGQRYKIAVTYKENEFKFYRNGILITTDTSGANPIGLNKLSLAYSNDAFTFEGKVYGVRYYDTVLTDAELTELTTL